MTLPPGSGATLSLGQQVVEQRRGDRAQNPSNAPDSASIRAIRSVHSRVFGIRDVDKFCDRRGNLFICGQTLREKLDRTGMMAIQSPLDGGNQVLIELPFD
jgi:hypothetical protein